MKTRQEEMLDRLRAGWADCRRCKLANERKQVVLGIGPAPAPLMVIGEAPGAEEDGQGIPFVGAAGRLFRTEALKVGLDPTACYITNVVGCRPPRNDLKPFGLIPMIECHPRLDALVHAVEPRAILVLGSTALLHISAGMKQGINRCRGYRWLSTWSWKGTRREIDTWATFHPAGLLPGRIDDPRKLDWFRRDLEKVSNYAFHGILCD